MKKSDSIDSTMGHTSEAAHTLSGSQRENNSPQENNLPQTDTPTLAQKDTVHAGGKLMKNDAEHDKDTEYKELIELLQRTQANFENYKKQTEKRIGALFQVAAKEMVIQLLPIIDNFELALRSLSQDRQNSTNGSTKKESPQNESSKDSVNENFAENEDFVKGMELIYAQFTVLLEKHNVHPIETVGVLFNPHRHEALMKVPSDLPENTILEEFQKGYTLNDMVIRPARVKISAGKKS